MRRAGALRRPLRWPRSWDMRSGIRRQIPTEGITKLTDVDFSYAARLGASIKLFGTSIRRDGRYYLEVAPVFINARNPLYSVSGVFNGILLNSNMLGESMYYGSGAGKLPTASAVVGDMIAAVQLKDRPAPQGWTGERLEVLPVRRLPWRYFARFEGSRQEKKRWQKSCLEMSGGWS
jgi:homoserine dehydrogenase